MEGVLGMLGSERGTHSIFAWKAAVLTCVLLQALLCRLVANVRPYLHSMRLPAQHEALPWLGVGSGVDA